MCDFLMNLRRIHSPLLSFVSLFVSGVAILQSALMKYCKEAKHKGV